MLRGIVLLTGLMVLILAGGCKDREQSSSQSAVEEKAPGIEKGTVPVTELRTDEDIIQQTDQAEEKTEKAKERLEVLSEQARELAREAEVVGEKVDSVTQQVVDLNTRLDQVAGAATEVIEQARQALKEVEKARENLKKSADNLFQEFTPPSEQVLPSGTAPEVRKPIPPNDSEEKAS